MSSLINIFSFQVFVFALFASTLGISGFYSETLVYLASLMMILFIVVGNGKLNLRFDNNILLIFCLSLYCVAAFVKVKNIESYNLHYMYVSVLFTLCFSILSFTKKPISLSRKIQRRFVFLIRISLWITLIPALTHLYFGNGRLGWSWPVNISIQEIFILTLVMTLITINGVKKNIMEICTIVFLLFERSSGKTALTVLLIFVFLSLCGKISQVRKLAPIMLHGYFVANIFILGLLLLFFSEQINYAYGLKYNLIYDKVPFFKRLSLILEALFLLQDPRILIFGGGFHSANYLSLVESYLNNTPQVLILTLLVYGGVFFYFAYYTFYILLVKSIEIGLTPLRKYHVHIYFFCMLLFLTTHEYFANPVLYISLLIFMIGTRCESR